MKKKKFLMVLPIFMVCIIGSGCASKQSENNCKKAVVLLVLVRSQTMNRQLV